MANQKDTSTSELEPGVDAGWILRQAMAYLLESDRDRRCGFEIALLSKAYRDTQYPRAPRHRGQPVKSSLRH
jgi:hypothetical protein